jgi:hypothetical protein
MVWVKKTITLSEPICWFAFYLHCWHRYPHQFANLQPKRRSVFRKIKREPIVSYRSVDISLRLVCATLIYFKTDTSHNIIVHTYCEDRVQMYQLPRIII